HGLLPGVVTADQRRGEGRRLTGGQTGQGLVQAVEHGAGTDLVGDPGDGVDLLVPDLGGQVDGDEVPLLGGSLDTDEAAEPLPQLVQLGVDVGVGDLRRLDGQRDRGQVGDLELGTDI